MPTKRPIWLQWQRITRFHHMMPLLMNEEAARVNVLQPDQRMGIEVKAAPPRIGFKLTADEYDGVLADRGILSSMVLVFSWALFEAHCLDILAETKAKGALPGWKPEFDLSFETWGGRLLAAQGASWVDVAEGEGSIIEAATLRNAIVHGQTTISESMVHRLTANLRTTTWKIGDPIEIDFTKCDSLRASLKSYARLVEGKPRTLKVAKAPARTKKRR